MRYRKYAILLLPLFLFAFASPFARSAFGDHKRADDGWWLSGAKVIDEGQWLRTEQGLLLTGYKIEARVHNGAVLPFQQGVFAIELSAFQPAQEMPGQQAGRWYVSGKWTIANANAKDNWAGRHDPQVIRGHMQWDTALSPFSQQARESVQDIPLTLLVETPGGWSRSQGMFTGTMPFNGTMSGKALQAAGGN